MKSSLTKSLLLAASLAALTTARLAAHPEHEFEEPAPAPAPPAEEHGHAHSTKVPDTVAGITKEIARQQGLLEKTVSDRNLGDAHDHAFAIRDLAKALPAKIPDADKARVEPAVQRIAELATDIDKSSSAGAQKTTEANVQAMARAIKTLHLALPHGH